MEWATLDRTYAGKFRDGRKQAHPWLRVFGESKHRESGRAYYLVQESGSGAGWIPKEEIELYPDQPAP